MTTSVTVKARAWSVKVSVNHGTGEDVEHVVNANSSHEFHLAHPTTISSIVELHPSTIVDEPSVET